MQTSWEEVVILCVISVCVVSFLLGKWPWQRDSDIYNCKCNCNCKGCRCESDLGEEEEDEIDEY